MIKMPLTKERAWKMNEKIKQKANDFIQKRILQTGKPFDELELPQVYDIIIQEAKKEVFNDIEKFDSRFGHTLDECKCSWCSEYRKVKKRHLSIGTSGFFHTGNEHTGDD